MTERLIGVFIIVTKEASGKKHLMQAKPFRWQCRAKRRPVFTVAGVQNFFRTEFLPPHKNQSSCEDTHLMIEEAVTQADDGQGVPLPNAEETIQTADGLANDRALIHESLKIVLATELLSQLIHTLKIKIQRKMGYKMP